MQLLTPSQSGAKEHQIGWNKPEYGKGAPFLHTAQSSHNHDTAKTPTVSKDLEKDVRYIKTRKISAVALGSEEMQLFSHNRGKGIHCSFRIHTD